MIKMYVKTEIDIFHPSITECEFDFVALPEINLNIDVISSSLFPIYCEVYRSDRKFDVVNL